MANLNFDNGVTFPGINVIILATKNKDPAERYRVLKPFFLMAKQTAHKNYKLRVTQALSRLARHVKVIDEIKSLWQPVLDLLLDADYETRFALSESLRDLVEGLLFVVCFSLYFCSTKPSN